MTAKVESATKKALAKIVQPALPIKPEDRLGIEVMAARMNYCAAWAAYFRPALAGEPENKNQDEAQFLRWSDLAFEAAKYVAPYQSPRLLAHAIATLPGDGRPVGELSAKERIIAMVMGSIAADKVVKMKREAVTVTVEPAPAEPEDEDDGDGTLMP